MTRNRANLGTNPRTFNPGWGKDPKTRRCPHQQLSEERNNPAVAGVSNITLGTDVLRALSIGLPYGVDRDTERGPDQVVSPKEDEPSIVWLRCIGPSGRYLGPM